MLHVSVQVFIAVMFVALLEDLFTNADVENSKKVSATCHNQRATFIHVFRLVELQEVSRLVISNQSHFTVPHINFTELTIW